MTSAKSIDALTERVQRALSAPGCERLKEWAAIGPVQRAAVEQFAQSLETDLRAQLEFERGVSKQHAAEKIEMGRTITQLQAQLEAARGQQDALHGAIMNIPCNVETVYGLANEIERAVYKIGHRDARHAAAELVNGMKVKRVMGKQDRFVGAPVEIGADVFTRLCMPIVREATRKANPTAKQMGQLYAGFIGACIGSMIADVGKEQAIAWAQQTLDMVAGGDFNSVSNPGGIHERKGH